MASVLKSPLVNVASLLCIPQEHEIGRMAAPTAWALRAWMGARTVPWSCAAVFGRAHLAPQQAASCRSLFGNTSSLQEITYDRMPGDFESVARLRGPDMLLPLSEMSASPVELQTLYNLGKDPAPEDLVVFAQFLRRELAIRTAQRAVELARLPHGLSEKAAIQEVCGWYAEAASKLVQSEVPDTQNKEKDFSKLLKSMLRDHTSVVRNLAIGCMEVKRDVGPMEWSRIHDDIDRVLTRFYTSRIGLRFLMEQHITGKQTRHSAHAVMPASSQYLMLTRERKLQHETGSQASVASSKQPASPTKSRIMQPQTQQVCVSNTLGPLLRSKLCAKQTTPP